MRLLFLSTILLTAPALALPVCEGGSRAERKLTCIVEGDTGWERGGKWNLRDIGMPEISQPECQAELVRAQNASAAAMGAHLTGQA